MSEPSPITQCLHALRDGEATAFDRLVNLLYPDLRRLAQIQLAGRGPQTLNPTALVHEAYVRLAGREDLDYSDQGHFMAVCSVVMRNIAIDFARRRKASKRGGDRERITFREDVLLIESQADDLLAIDQALTKMQELSPRMVRVVECRFFAGLTDEETAGALDISPRTVQREWVKARALLRDMLGEAA